jgi:thiazole synthase
MNAEEAVRLARLAVAAGLPKWVKLEIHPDPHYLLPDPIETLAAAEILVKDGFTVLPYINADPVLARRLQDVGTATVMPLGSPIGSNRGLDTRAQIEIIIKQALRDSLGNEGLKGALSVENVNEIAGAQTAGALDKLALKFETGNKELSKIFKEAANSLRANELNTKNSLEELKIQTAIDLIRSKDEIPRKKTFSVIMSAVKLRNVIKQNNYELHYRE